MGQVEEFRETGHFHFHARACPRLDGDDADSDPLSPALEVAVAEGKAGLALFNAQRSLGLSNEVLRPLIHEVGRSAKLLQRRPGVEVRDYSDFSCRSCRPRKSPGTEGTGPTAFHQDLITFAVDRSGGHDFRFALGDYTSEAGTMSFVNGSHRAGVLGDYTTYGGGDALDAFPELRDLEMSDAMNYELGDITVHTHLTVHGAGPNLMDHPRWAYILVTQPSDVCWNGSPCPNFDSTSMNQWETLGDERFPVIS